MSKKLNTTMPNQDTRDKTTAMLISFGKYVVKCHEKDESIPASQVIMGSVLSLINFVVASRDMLESYHNLSEKAESAKQFEVDLNTAIDRLNDLGTLSKMALSSDSLSEAAKHLVDNLIKTAVGTRKKALIELRADIDSLTPDEIAEKLDVIGIQPDDVDAA